MKSILIIDDDIDFCCTLRDYLAMHAIDLRMQHNGAAGLASLQSEEFDMALLDVMLPDADGLELMSRIRSFSSMSILMLSALGDEAARIVGLDEGADDYLAKPFNPRELLSRMRAIWRRTETASPDAPTQNTIPDFVLNHDAREAYYDGNRLPLTEVEFTLLSILLDSPGTVLVREDLVARVFQRSFHPLDRSLDVHICRLRKKLEIVPKLGNSIKTVRNLGYLFSSVAGLRVRASDSQNSGSRSAPDGS
jgi:two-component system, OmpR family, response regulator CpxR